jgi:hypothetical protein
MDGEFFFFFAFPASSSLHASMLGAISTTTNPFYTSAEVFKQLNSFRAKPIITQSQYVSQKHCELKTLVSSPPPSMTC